MKLRTKLTASRDGSLVDATDENLITDAACAHALMQEIAVLRDASESMESAHGRLVLKLLDLLDDRAERLMREWGFDSGEDSNGR